MRRLTAGFDTSETTKPLNCFQSSKALRCIDMTVKEGTQVIVNGVVRYRSVYPRESITKTMT